MIVTPVSGTTVGTSDNRTLVHRFGNKLYFEVSVLGLPLQGGFIRIPLTKSVKHTTTGTGLGRCLNLNFVLRGADTRKLREFACRSCKDKVSRDLVSLTRVDFTERQDTISLEDGKARISFKFTCYPSHDDDGGGLSTDREYM